jgi:hypothetical protein
MMDIVAAWCRGASFGDICKMTDLFEGTFNWFINIFVWYWWLMPTNFFCFCRKHHSMHASFGRAVTSDGTGVQEHW